MKNCYDGVLAMPQSYAVMGEEEMTYLNGGSANFDCCKDFLSKSKCKEKAAQLIDDGEVTGMTETAIAKEIFAHAYSYYNYAVVALRFGVVIAAYCYNKAANGITIADGGDTGLRKSAYTLFWNTFPTNTKYD